VVKHLLADSSSNGSWGGSCHKIGPSFSPSRSTPDDRKFASAVSKFLSLSMCVMYRLPLMAKRKSSGTAARHPSHVRGRVSE
jgi:hypothetical protein